MPFMAEPFMAEPLDPASGALPYVDPELLVATCTADGDVVFRNPAWRTTFGSATNPWSRLFEGERKLVLQALTQAADGTLVTNHLCPVAVPEREDPLPVLMNFLPVFLPVKNGGLNVQAITITGETLTEPTSWTPSQTQRHRMEALGRMTMGVAHDFNNLLSGVLGHAELLQKALVREDAPASFLESVSTIEQAATDGAALVEKIQRYIRQENQTHFERIDLPSLIEGCVALTRPYWYNEPRRTGISIDISYDMDPVPPIRGVAPELREVFVNLILNAVQALPEGGRITFSTTFEAERGVIVTVADDGLGMRPDVKQRIFEPLYTTKGSEGTGMGLAVSHGIMQEHEGEISVESEPGQGTRFRLVFPEADDETAPAAETSLSTLDEDEKVTQRPARVLVVDDEKMVRSVLVKLLTLKGHDVGQAASGAEALALTEDDHFDIVFTDHGMPSMNGRQLARALRRRFPDLPIVLLTGDTEVRDTPDVTALMSKPFKLNELESAIQQFVL